MATNPGHNLRIPQGRMLAQLLRQLWKEQEAAVLNILRQTDGMGMDLVNLNLWFSAFVERIKPVYARYLVDGQQMMQERLQQSRNKSVVPLPWVTWPPTAPPVEELPLDDEFNIYNPEAVAFINNYSYWFSNSTNNTTKLRLSVAYQRFKEKLTQGIERGQSLKELTGEVMRIFRDPERAMTIAATEVSRAYHAGQLIAAKKSGVVSGKQWLASSDACELCLKLNGKIVPLDEPFAVIGSGPYARVMFPPGHPRCFCTWIEVLTDRWRLAA